MSGKSYGEIQGALQAALAATVKGDDDSWVWVSDFDDDTVIYSSSGEMFQSVYTMDGSGNVTLGDPVQVRPVTTYAPVGDKKGLRPFESRGLPSQPPQRPQVEVKSEPLTYHRYRPDRSYFRDLVLVDRDPQAQLRLEAHAREMAVEIPAREARAWRRAADSGMEFRVNPNRIQGQGGYFAPPLWIIDQFATAPRAPRVLAGLVPTFPLPAGVQSINLPRLTTGNAEAAEADLDAVDGQDAADSQVQSPVMTINGQADVALQLLEQSPQGAHLDWAMGKDLSEAYDAALEAQMVVGVSTAETYAGVFNQCPSGNIITYTDASPTLAEMYPFIGQASAAVGKARKMPVQVWLMTTARWSWIATSEDQQLRPIVPPDLSPPQRSIDGYLEPVSSMYGWPVFPDDAIPITLNSNQDTIIACRPSDLMLFEGDPRIMVGLEVLSGVLMARIQYRRYSAALTGRYPSGIAVVTGSGMVPASGF